MTATAVKAQARDLEADLVICEAAKWETWDDLLWHIPKADFHFVDQARTGWPYAIRRALEAEAENDRLRAERDQLQEQLNQNHISHWD